MKENLGDINGIGKNTDNALGLGTWSGNDDTEHWRYTHLEKIELPTKATGIATKLGCSLAWNKEGHFRLLFATQSPCSYNFSNVFDNVIFRTSDFH